MSDLPELPRIPKAQIEAPERKISELKRGDQVVLSGLFHIVVDEQHHVWIDTSMSLQKLPVIPGSTYLAERTADGFILWIDKRSKFRLRKLERSDRYLPVVMIREAAE